MFNTAKSAKIKATILANRLRRKDMDIKVFEVKVDESALSRKKKKLIKNVFIQAKWLYNNVISSDSIFNFDRKIKNVDVLVFNQETQKCDIIQNRELSIGSQIKQSIIKRAAQNIINLSKARAKGLKIGSLKPKKEVNSIPLQQYGVTFKIKNDKYIFVQGIGKLKVSGIEQTVGCEFANAILFKKATGIFIKLTCYKEKKNIEKNGVIGIDFGIKDSITTSDGQKFNWNFPIPNELKRKQHKLSKKKKGSKNYVKQCKKVQKSYQKLTNKKDDAANQFVNKIKKYEKVVIQDENIKGWHSGLFGKQVQQSILGRIKTRIINLETSVVINRWIPTTKISPINGEIIKITLKDREFKHLSFSEDRDIKSAKTILCIGLYNPKITRKELMGLPVEEITSVFSSYKFESISIFPLNQEALAL